LKENSCFKIYLSINTVRSEITSYKSFFTIYGCTFETYERYVDAAGLLDLPQRTSWLRIRALL